MHRVAPGVIWLTALSGLLACSDSTESVDQAFVTISSESPVVLRGDQLELTARLWTRTSPGDSVEVRNAELIWSTGDPTLATLTPKDNNTTIATGVNSGTVDIRAVATGFEGAAHASYSLRVSDPLEIDSIRPSTVRYGEKLTLYGIGVSSLFLASLEGPTLVPDTFSVTSGVGGLGQFSFWLPPPASSGRVVVLSPTQIVTAAESTFVIEEDLFEPNGTSPQILDLSLPTFPALPAIRFYNPALAFETLPRGDTLGLDWYRLAGATAGGDLTVILVAPSFKNAHLTFLAAAVNTADSVSNPAWTIGSGLYYCKDHPFKVAQQSSDSLVVALRNVPAESMDLISLFAISGRYGVAVVEGYVTSNPGIGPDRLEENDNCEFADRNFSDPATQVDLATPFSDSLTIDNPHDVDWIRIRVPATVSQPVAFRTAPAAHLEGKKRGDIDLHVLGIPVPGSPLEVHGSSQNDGSTESLNLVLAPGEYYIVVTDFAGTPIRYSLCAAVGISCSLQPGYVSSALMPQLRGTMEPRAGWSR